MDAQLHIVPIIFKIRSFIRIFLLYLLADRQKIERKLSEGKTILDFEIFSKTIKNFNNGTTYDLFFH